MSLTDSEIIELEHLYELKERDELHDGLIHLNDKVNPNYKFIHNAIENNEYSGCALEGSSRCFSPNQLVVTDNGSKPISLIKKGDKILTYNESKKIDEYLTVIKPLSFSNNKNCLRITLKNGEIIECTEDHEFYYKGAWVSIKHIVSLWHDKKKDKR